MCQQMAGDERQEGVESNQWQPAKSREAGRRKGQASGRESGGAEQAAEIILKVNQRVIMNHFSANRLAITLGRLKQVGIDSSGDGTNERVEQYIYNDDGTRLQTTAIEGQTVVTDYVIDANNPTGYAQVLEEWTAGATPNLARSFVIGHSILSQWTDGATPQVLLLLADGHGSTQMVVDSAGVIQQSYDYDAYGNLINPPASPLTDHLYTGEQFDARIGQYYLRARYYNPATGRFFRLDPYAGSSQDPLTLHKYVYASIDAINYCDPSGQFTSVEVSVSMFIGAMLFTLMSPNIANAPAPGDPHYLDDSGGMVANAAFVAITAPPLIIAGRIIGPLIKKAFNIAPKPYALVRTARGTVRIPGMVTGDVAFADVGPLSEQAASTFMGYRYRIITTADDVYLFRGWGGPAEEFTGFWSTSPPAGSLQMRIDQAIRPEWNALTDWTMVRVPKGSTLFVGETGPQTAVIDELLSDGRLFLGGDCQVLVEGGVQSSWKVGGGALH